MIHNILARLFASEVAAADNGRGVWLCHYQLWGWCGRRAIEIGQCVSPLLIAVVIVLIFDMSHSRVGLIQVGQQPLVDLQQSMMLHQ